MSERNEFKYGVCIIGGAGHVGLPLAVAFAVADVKTVILDINAKGLQEIMGGKFPFKEDQGAEKLQEALKKDNLNVSTDPVVIGQSEQVIMVIGTPIDEYLNPNFLGIIKALDNYFDHFRDGQTLILRSTVYPGTSERVQNYFRDKGKNIRVAFCPERIVEGKAFEEFKNLPQIVSAFDSQTLSEVTALFKHITDRKIVPVKPVEAELAKLYCNAWRYIQFAAANQFFMIAEEQGADYYQVYQAMKEDYPRMKDLPGPGFAAGPCLLKDTMQLSAFNNNNFFLGHTAMLTNEGLPNFLIKEIEKRYGRLQDKTIGILGMSFKAESDDQRDSLSFKLRKIAATKCKKVLCHDFYIQSKEFFSLEDVLKQADIIILATPHKKYKELVVPSAHPGKIFIDVWNFWGGGFDIVA